jgi:steroid delta-isomerase-like uncharacterized protein
MTIDNRDDERNLVLSNDPERELVHRYFEDFFSAPGQFDLADELLSPDVIFTSPVSPGPLRGLSAFKGFAKNWYDGFTDRKFVVDDLVCQKNRAASSFTMTGTHDGPFAGIEPTGQKLIIRGANIFHIEQSKIRVINVFFFAVPKEMVKSQIAM